MAKSNPYLQTFEFVGSLSDFMLLTTKPDSVMKVKEKRETHRIM